MKGKVDIKDLDCFKDCLLNDPETGNTLLLIPFKNKYYLYHIKIKDNKLIDGKQKRFYDPPKFDILNKVEKYQFLEQAEARVVRKLEFDKNLHALIIKEQKPLRKSLNYKLNIAAFVYLSYKEMYHSGNFNDP